MLGERGAVVNWVMIRPSKIVPLVLWKDDGSANHLGGIVQVGSGNTSTPALLSPMGEFCAGENGTVNGRLGNTSNPVFATYVKDHPVTVKGGESGSTNLSDMVQIDVGYSHSPAPLAPWERCYAGVMEAVGG